MNNSYAFQRPKTAPSVNKRVRRKLSVIKPVNDKKNSFKYTCFDCNNPVNIEYHSEIEIECTNCSCRIIRKNSTVKAHIVEAI